MKKSTKVVLILSFFFLLWLLIGWFYWFQYRPSQARKECVADLAKFEGATVGNAELLFKICLHKKGL